MMPCYFISYSCRFIFFLNLPYEKNNTIDNVIHSKSLFTHYCYYYYYYYYYRYDDFFFPVHFPDLESPTRRVQLP